MVERVMILDAVLADHRRWWLGPESDKRAFFDVTQQTGLRPEDYPHIAFGVAPRKTIRCFPDKLPIGIRSMSREERNRSIATSSDPNLASAVLNAPSGGFGLGVSDDARRQLLTNYNRAHRPELLQEIADLEKFISEVEEFDRSVHRVLRDALR
jgi:hypothetical protein